MSQEPALDLLLCDPQSVMKVLDAGAIGLWEYHHRDGEPRWCARVAAILGRCDTARPSDGWFDLVHPEDRSQLRGWMEAALVTDAPVIEAQFRVQHQDGEWRWLRGRGRVIERDTAGTPLRTAGTLCDITEQKRAERENQQLNRERWERLVRQRAELDAHTRKLREREDQLHEAMAASNIGLWDWNLQTGEVDLDSIHALLDDDPGEPAPSVLPRWQDLLHADDADTAVDVAERQLRDTGRCEVECRQRVGDAGHRWMLWRGKVVARDALGAPVRAIGTFMDIDARKHTGDLNRRLATIIEASTDLIASGTLTGQIDYLNQAGRALLGIGALDDLGQMRIEDCFPSWAYQRVISEGLTTARRCGQWLGDTALLRYDGIEVPVSQLVMVHRSDETGDIEFITTICRDLSDRLQAQAALQQLQQEQELILDTLPALIWYKDTTNRILLANQAVADSLGLPKAQIAGRNSAELYPAEADRYYQDDLIVIQTGTPRLGIEEPHRLPSGEQRWIRTDKVPLKDASGRVLRILVMALDITRQKAVEAALRISQEDLQRAQAVAKIGSWRLDVQRNVLTWSVEAHRIFGIPVGTPLTYETFLSTVHPEDQTAVNQAWLAALQGEPYDIEHRVIVDGQIKWVQEKAELEFSDGGKLLGGFGTSQDITERKQIDEALRDADRRKDEFLAVLAHELRNPLAPIQSATDILACSADDGAAVTWCSELIERQVQHLTRLVDDLFDIARISSGKIQLHQESLAVADIVQRAAETSRPLIAARRHELFLHLPAEPLGVKGDLIRLAQVISNLLNNAAKYTEPGGRIDLSVQQEDDTIVLRVRDTGIGIPPTMLDRVFDMFAQVNRSREQSPGGLGIGLNIVKQLIALHGGTIAVQSAGEGAGAEFIIRLPRVSVPSPVSAPGQSAPTTRPVRRRILVADDDVDVADSLTLLLDILGHEVRTARDGMEALEIAAQFKPELILMDLGMPRLNGYDACRRLRTDPAGAGAVIVALTGWGQDRHHQATAAAGFDLHLVKPVGLAELQGLIDRLSGTRGESE
ncbi:PAS domain-containing protein [uncultured Lamprocystis sp.]|jgi:PAS domain S-box-containing protein|uniref:hybrid sensor histidine kinase/response regulator n=1 Tax=uncultured Lamprocystis sp. TaxID=543132 RepID=UPI0025D815BB|nr:PAS domain-containing protein [uncultured Lamprocystis sp.]